MKQLLFISKHQNRFLLMLLLSAFYFITGCRKTPTPELLIPKFLSGQAQKGPLLNGSTVTIFELNDSYTQTGKSFSTQVTNNLGSFSLNNITLATDFVSLRANGYYFNEVCGENSIAPITLDCIADIRNHGSVNINLLTHLEKPRVEYLISNGQNFMAAKWQAQQEVLAIFNMASSIIGNSEALDISQTGEGNAILLAVTSILQGVRSESELSNLLSDISNDISTDGILNDSTLQSSLIDHALLLDTTGIRTNISNYYGSRNMPVSVANFEHYLSQFINNSSYARTGSIISYPAQGLNGDNILNKTQTNYTGNCSFAARSKKCLPLKIKLKVLNGLPYWLSLDVGCNWRVSPFDFTAKEQIFEVIDINLAAELIFKPNDNGAAVTVLVQYFESGGNVPTFSKTIVCTN